jgi:hypothetical protein
MDLFDLPINHLKGRNLPLPSKKTKSPVHFKLKAHSNNSTEKKFKFQEKGFFITLRNKQKNTK